MRHSVCFRLGITTTRHSKQQAAHRGREITGQRAASIAGIPQIMCDELLRLLRKVPPLFFLCISPSCSCPSCWVARLAITNTHHGKQKNTNNCCILVRMWVVSSCTKTKLSRKEKKTHNNTWYTRTTSKPTHTCQSNETTGTHVLTHARARLTATKWVNDDAKKGKPATNRGEINPV